MLIKNLLGSEAHTLKSAIENEEAFAVSWQVRLSSVEERATKAERERKDLVSSLERQLAAARAEILDWRRELAAAEAERDRLAADRKALAKRASSGSLYAGYGGTPKARGAHPSLVYQTQHAGVHCHTIPTQPRPTSKQA